MKELLVSAVAAALLLQIAACGTGEEKPSSPPNVLLVVVDTLRADHLGAYGYKAGVSPNLDAFAAGATLYDRCYSQAPWTKPSVASLFTSRYPTELGLHKPGDTLKEESVSMAEVLRENGYTTGGIVSHIFLDEKFGYSQGFDEYVNVVDKKPHFQITSHQVSDLAVQWLEKHREEKFFLFLHYFDPHYNYLTHEGVDYPEGYSGMLERRMDIKKLRDRRDEISEADLEYLLALYDGEITFTDRHLQRVFDALDELGLSEETMVVFTSDHGEEFMTHGWIGHTRTLYNELVHVPLIIRYPGGGQGERVEGVFELTDVLPTVAAAGNISSEGEGWQGRVLPRAAAQGGAFPDRYAFSEVSYKPGKKINFEKTAFKRSLQNLDWKLVLDLNTKDYEYFSLANDPVELDNLYGSGKDAAARMESLLGEKITLLESNRGGSREADLTEEEIENLRSLGYIQ